MRFRGSVLLTIVALMAALALPASAALKLKLDNGSTAIEIVDNQAGDNCLLVGQICNEAGAVDGWVVSTTFGMSSPIVGPGVLGLTSFNVGFSSAGTLIITLSDTDFVPPAPTGDGALVLNAGGTMWSGGTLPNASFQGHVDGPSGLVSTSQLNFSASSFSGTAYSDVFNLQAPYSLTQVMTITMGPSGGFVLATATLGFVPEPTSMVLVGGVLLFVSSMLRRRAARL